MGMGAQIWRAVGDVLTGANNTQYGIGGLIAGAAAGAVLQPVRWPQQGAALRTTVVVGLGATFLVAGVAAATTFTTTPLF